MLRGSFLSKKKVKRGSWLMTLMNLKLDRA